MRPGNGLRIAWILTAIAALVLAAITAVLAFRTYTGDAEGAKAYVTSSNPTVFLRDEPSGGGRVVSVLTRDQEVRLLDTVERDGRLWARVCAAGETGWLAAANLSSTPPGEGR